MLNILLMKHEKTILGIDVSKDELVIFDNSTKRITLLANTETALESAVSEFGWVPGDYLIGIESTGDFGLLVMKFFIKQGFRVIMLNPIVTKRFIKSTIRNKKTDKSDAEAIATMISAGEGQIVTKKDLEIAKKTLIRLEQKITAMAANLKRLQHSLELKVASGIDLKNAQDEISSLIKEMEKTSQNLWQMAKEEKVNRQEQIIASHPGCGEKLSAIISTEAGDIKRFPSASQLKAYAGIDPRVIQSGTMDKRGKMTKRGNPVLRHALFIAAFVASNHDPELKEYYQKKRAEGKSHVHAVCTVARKLCERIYATVTQDRFYEVKEPSKLST